MSARVCSVGLGKGNKKIQNVLASCPPESSAGGVDRSESCPPAQEGEEGQPPLPGSLSVPPNLGSPDGSVGKASACNTGDLASIPGSGRAPGEGNGNPLKYFCLENLMDRGA